MRSIERIDKFCNEIAEIWKEKVPDWRFGQIISNFDRYMRTKGVDIFFLEENQFMKYFKEFLNVDDENAKS